MKAETVADSLGPQKITQTIHKLPHSPKESHYQAGDHHSVGIATKYCLRIFREHCDHQQSAYRNNCRSYKESTYSTLAYQSVTLPEKKSYQCLRACY